MLVGDWRSLVLFGVSHVAPEPSARDVTRERLVRHPGIAG